MGWMTRFEPATSGSTDRRSNQLSYIHHKSSIVIILIFGRFCQKNFPPRFCKPGQTNKQPPYKICRRRAQKFSRARQFKQARKARRERAFCKAAPQAHTSRRTRNSKRSHPPHRARPKHTNSAGSGRSTRARHANPAAPGVATLFSRCRRLRGGQMAQALAHLVLCQHPFFRRPQTHL